MVKIIMGALMFLSISSSALGQSETNNPFANKTFLIKNYIDGKFDNTEDLTFSDNEVEGSICVQYGFERSEYEVKTIKNSNPDFTTTMYSKEHGKMVWKGSLDGTKINGQYLWTKDGQEPIYYTFTGELKK